MLFSTSHYQFIYGLCQSCTGRQKDFFTDQNFKKEIIEISKLSLFIAILRLGEGYGMNFYFHNIRAPFATTRSFFIQVHLTKFYMVFWFIYKHFHKKVFSVMCHIGGIPRRRNDFFPKNRSRQKLHRFHFSIFFSKFQKELLEHIEPQLS